MDIHAYDHIFTVDCNNVQYLFEIGKSLEEISPFDNNFYYKNYLISKKYYYIDFDQGMAIETDDATELAKYITNFDDEQFSYEYIFLNKAYTIQPIKMLFESYQVYPKINEFLITFYDWANVIIIYYSKLKDNIEIDFSKTIISTNHLNPYVFSMMSNLLPLNIFYHERIYNIKKNFHNNTIELNDITE